VQDSRAPTFDAVLGELAVNHQTAQRFAPGAQASV
jgi:hypothetical protein